MCLTKIQWSNRNYQATEGMLCARTGERQLAQIASLLWQVEREREGGQLKSLRNHAWSQMLTPTVDFLLHLLCQLPFQSFNCMYTAQGMNSNLDLVSLLAPPLSAGSRCYRARQSDEANQRPMDAIFTGPRFLWGPVCGSRCLSLTSSDTFG